MAFEIIKNEIIKDGPYAGEPVSGYDFFTGEPLVPVNGLIVKRFTCDRCGRPQDLPVSEQGGPYLCDNCRDEAAPQQKRQV